MNTTGPYGECGKCGKPFLKINDFNEHRQVCAANEAEFGRDEIVVLKEAATAFFEKWAVRIICPSKNGGYVYTLESITCRSLVITAGEGALRRACE